MHREEIERVRGRVVSHGRSLGVREGQQQQLRGERSMAHNTDRLDVAMHRLPQQQLESLALVGVELLPSSLARCLLGP